MEKNWKIYQGIKLLLIGKTTLCLLNINENVSFFVICLCSCLQHW